MPDIASLVARVSIVLAVLLALPPGLAAEPVRLEAGWELITDPGATLQVASLPTSGWRPAKVGVSWNAQFADLRDYVGVAWYRTRFTVPASKAPQRVLLRFGAADYQADVFVNGEAAGSHEGAYTPFTLDVTGRVKPGTNELVVRVIDPPAAGRGRDPRFPQFDYDELPRGKQNWYIQNGGSVAARVARCPPGALHRRGARLVEGIWRHRRRRRHRRRGAEARCCTESRRARRPGGRCRQSAGHRRDRRREWSA